MSEPIMKDRLTEDEKKQLEAERIAQYTAEEQKKYYERKAKRAETKVQRVPAETVRAWVREQSDSLVIATHYNPQNVLLALLPYLKCARPFVVYSEYLEPLSSLFLTLQKMDSIIDMQLSETWTREYQILPGRTHPEMKMNNFSGYLLTGTKAAHLSGPELRALLASRAHAEAEPAQLQGNDDDENENGTGNGDDRERPAKRAKKNRN
jgi:tRNA (adenine58-N1)-methyltransferase non-catalytic subunit